MVNGGRQDRIGVALRQGGAVMGTRRNWMSAAVAFIALTSPLEAWGQSYSTPIGCDDCISWWYYVDHGETVDYTCGGATYPGHRGTDYSLQGGNNAIDNGNEIVAAAPGVVTIASDGSFDRCTSCGGDGCGVDTPGGGFANYVVIDHGSHTTTYGHMRNGSVAVSEGDTVECGQVLGHIGSAGCSSGAHLHFQPRMAGANYQEILDPYVGECSPTLESLWVEQGPYRDVPGDTCSELSPDCPEDTFEIWTCNVEETARRRCIDGIDSTEGCEFGCMVNADGVDDECALPPDVDGDGSRADTDCDDDNASIHPAAIERCGDGVDQDCSGADASCEPDEPGTGGSAGVGGSVGPGSSGGAPTTVGGTPGSGGVPGTGGTLGSGGVLVGEPDPMQAGDSPTPNEKSGAEEEAGCSCATAPGKARPSAPWGLLALGVPLVVGRFRRSFLQRRRLPSPI